jgi:STE24 endopeptidase
MFITLLVAVILSIAGPYLLLTFISYSVTKEARKLTATKKDLMIKMITPVLISAIFFLTFFAVFCLPLLFLEFRELYSYTPLFVFYLFLSFAISSILSRVIAPVIYNYIERVEPINDPQIRKKVSELLRKGNLKCRNILLVKDAKWKNANAMVSGIFQRFRFLYLTDYLINNFSIDEIETIIAHELGHIRHKHLEKFILFSIIVFGVWAGVGLFLTLYLNVHFDPWNIIVVSAIPCMAISFLFNFLSRRFELQADAYAVELTKKPEIYISALRKLAQINDMSFTQSKSEEVTLTHPSFDRRIKEINKKMQKV